MTFRRTQRWRGEPDLVVTAGEGGKVSGVARAVAATLVARAADRPEWERRHDRHQLLGSAWRDFPVPHVVGHPGGSSAAMRAALTPGARARVLAWMEAEGYRHELVGALHAMGDAA